MEILPLAAALDPATPPRAGDLVHVESPINPYGEAFDISAYVAVARTAGAWTSVDATFGPPPLQDPLALGVDMVMHSGTKYIGGHSDMLCGILAVNPQRARDDKWAELLVEQRLHLGSVMGSFEGWLGLRSTRTVGLRVERQSRTAQALVDWIASALKTESVDANDENKANNTAVAKVVAGIRHASQQPEAADKDSWLYRQMPHGFGAVFAILMANEAQARTLPSCLEIFQHATSLGGVESLIEWRALSDKTIDKRLVRVSVGVESVEDLQADLQQAFARLAEMC